MRLGREPDSDSVRYLSTWLAPFTGLPPRTRTPSMSSTTPKLVGGEGVDVERGREARVREEDSGATAVGRTAVILPRRARRSARFEEAQGYAMCLEGEQGAESFGDVLLVGQGGMWLVYMFLPLSGAAALEEPEGGVGGGLDRALASGSTEGRGECYRRCRSSFTSLLASSPTPRARKAMRGRVGGVQKHLLLTRTARTVSSQLSASLSPKRPNASFWCPGRTASR